jgi:hypothetical protein
MTPQETRQILTNLVTNLRQQRDGCVQSGNIEAVLRIDADITSTQTTIDLLAPKE